MAIGSVIAVSPGRSPLHGNLTGIARKVKDSCADWHNYDDKWTVLNAKGAVLVNQIANVKLESIMSREAQEEADAGMAMPEEVHPLTEKLEKVYSDMARVVQKFESVTAALSGVADLEWYQQNESFCDEPLFQTWTTDLFYDTSKKLLVMFQKELALKETIVQNVAHAKTRDLIMTYSACWLHQAYIDDTKNVLLNSMLKETGLT